MEARREAVFRRRMTFLFSAVVVLILGLVFFLAFAVGPWKSSSRSRKVSEVSKHSAPRAEKEQGTTTASQPQPAGQDAGQASRTLKRSIPAPPAVAIVVDDVGSTTEKLPLWTSINAPISFSVMPYPPLSSQLADQFYQAGYQVMLHVPTENHPPNSFAGTGQLTTAMDRETVFGTLDKDLAAVPHAAGMNNHQGGLGCDDFQLMYRECEWASERALFVVDSSSSANSQVTRAAVQLGLGKRKNQVFIDHQNDPDYIRSAMRELAGLARQNGFAFGICHYGRPNTATVVGEMVRTLEAEGIHFAFAGDINN